MYKSEESSLKESSLFMGKTCWNQPSVSVDGLYLYDSTSCMKLCMVNFNQGFWVWQTFEDWEEFQKNAFRLIMDYSSVIFQVLFYFIFSLPFVQTVFVCRPWKCKVNMTKQCQSCQRYALFCEYSLRRSHLYVLWFTYTILIFTSKVVNLSCKLVWSKFNAKTIVLIFCKSFLWLYCVSKNFSVYLDTLQCLFSDLHVLEDSLMIEILYQVFMSTQFNYFFGIKCLF